MNPVVRAFGVTALLALMFGLLGKPILDATGGRASAPIEEPPAPVLPSPTPTADPTEEPPTPEPTLSPPTIGEPLLVGQYPAACSQPVDAVEDAGLVAAWYENRLQIASPTGGTIAELPEVRPPVQWSASGRFLVTRGPQLWTSEGQALGSFVHLATGARVADPDRGVAWSPIADCALVRVGDSGSAAVSVLVARPNVDPIELLRGDIRDLAFSPDGSRLAFIAKSGGRPAAGHEIWTVDLGSGSLERLLAFEGGTAQVVLAGWNGADILYWAAPGVSVAADGWELTGVSGNGRIRSYTRRATMLTESPTTFLELCADRLVGVLGGDRSFDPYGAGQTRGGSSPRLAFLDPGGVPEFITPEGETYYSPTCSPDDRYLVTIAGEGEARRLTLLAAGGAFLRTLTIDEGYADKDAIWGPSGAGVLFRRAPAGGGADVLWFIAEGAPARSLDLNVGTYDWSAERPSGLLGE